MSSWDFAADYMKYLVYLVKRDKHREKKYCLRFRLFTRASHWEGLTDWIKSEKPHDTIPIFIIHQPGTTNQTPTMMNCRNAETPCRTKSKLNNKTAVSLPYHSADLPPSSSVVSFHNNIGYHSITTLLLPLCYVQRPAKTTIPSTFIIIPLAVTDQSIGALPSSISLSHMSAPSAPVNYICTEAMVTWLLPERYCTSTYQL